MSLTSIAPRPLVSALGVAHPRLAPAFAFIPLVVAIYGGVLYLKLEEGFGPTFILAVGVASAGTYLIRRLSRQLGDPHLQNLGYVFLGKLLLVLVLLYAGWIPYLHQSSAAFGYDPQRYYFEAQELAASGFDRAVLPPLNHTGILFYYGFFFAVVSHNPVVPALVNTFVTLLATLLVVRVGYQLRGRPGPRDWMLGLYMVIPEVVWYDTISSRETLVTSLIAICLLSQARYCLSRPQEGIRFRDLAPVLPAFVLLGLVRLPMLLPTALSMLLLFALFKMAARHRVVMLVLVGLVVGAVLIEPILAENLGSLDVGYLSRLQFADQAEIVLYDMEWSERSVGRLLVASTPAQALLLAPARMLLYLSAPLPSVPVSREGLADGYWLDWQGLAAVLSSLGYALLFPLALASGIEAVRQSFRNRQSAPALVLHLPFWITLAAIAIGIQFVHERYRIMALPFLVGCIWLGFSCPASLLRRVYVVWCVLGILLVSGFFLYKYA